MGRTLKYSNTRVHYRSFYRFQFFSRFIAQAFLYSFLVIFTVFFVFIMIYFGDLIYNLQQGNGKMPIVNAYVIVSPSMVPTIQVNDAIVVRRIKGEDLEIGDIITFSSSDPSYPGLTVTHRIVGKYLSQKGGYIFRTKGDNNNLQDNALVTEDSIYGKVVIKVPNLGSIRQFLTTRGGFFYLILIPSLLIIFYEIYRVSSLLKQRYFKRQ